MHSSLDGVSGSRMPQELVEAVIDLVQDDRQALKACSLTSRRWTHRSREHLHKTVTIKLCASDLSIPRQRFKRIWALCTLPGITEYAREVHLCGLSKRVAGQLPGQEAPREVQHTPEELFWFVLGHFKHISSLIVSHLSFHIFTREQKDRLWTAFPLVKRLILKSTNFQNGEDFVSYLAQLPLLSRLSMRSVHWFDADLPASSMALLPGNTPGSNLSSLELCHGSSKEINCLASWLGALMSPRVESLHIIHPLGDLNGLSSLYRAIGSPLKHLSLVVDPDSRLDQAATDLITNDHIQSIVFDSLAMIMVDVVRAWRWILTILQKISPAELRAIRFQFCAEDMVHPLLGELDRLLSNPAFGCLAEVSFSFLVIGSSDVEVRAKTFEALTGALPRVAERGILRLLQRPWDLHDRSLSFM
ncbi:hypothetical protein PHLCEN_2v1666 [Hermanssonia centrifuga]|uniref:F-box domain-containing protein n=1 Tax=Hermanssonia centrifuga TaxID=98765 RepID=A0A2R6RZC2_9APHY|nr:hypothetical protein PHLCEN_2v1666 [Hermanssonia centrifuga]